MLAAIGKVDRAISFTRRGWVWLGQLGLIALGLHLGADRLDDVLHDALIATPIPWPTVEAPTHIAAWTALVVELLALVKAGTAVWLTPHQPTLSWRAWWGARSAEALVLPLFWAPTALAGAWVIGMAVEDQLAAVAGADTALAAGVLVGALVAWRLGWTGWVRVVGGLQPAKKPWAGWWWAPILWPLAVLAARYGVPLWGLL